MALSLDTSVSTTLPARLQNSCLVIGIGDKGQLQANGPALDKSALELIKKVFKRGDINGRVGETLLLQEVPGSSTDRVLLVGTGKTADISEKDYRRIVQATVTAVHATGAQSVATTLTGLNVIGPAEKALGVTWKTRVLVIDLAAKTYRFTLHKRKSTGDTAKSGVSLKKLHLLVQTAAEVRLGKIGASQALGIDSGSAFARDLGNLAPNICTPSYLASAAKRLQKEYKNLKVTVLDEAQMKKLGMGAMLSVSRGSRQPAKLICMDYRGTAAKTKPVVLVGKGITFDTGGISIKSSDSMDEMKYDMCGAASVMGAMQACLDLQLKCNLVCVVAAAENMPDGDASRPGDVVTTMSGQTVEILNTDAEGRLVLCDALTWVEKFKPAAVIDVATLTGACIVALGNVCSAVMGNNQQLTDQLLEAGQTSGDKTWQLPLWDDYQQQLDSNFADMANIGGRPAGSITAGCFLSRFAKKYPWAHLDIAGIAWHSGKNKGATGRPVPMLMQYLIDNHI